MSDHISGANSIESRLPFFDHVFLEKYWSMPIQDFFSNGRGKAHMRKMMSEINPLEAFSDNKPKRPKPGNYYAIINDDSMFDFAMQYLSIPETKKKLQQLRPQIIGNSEQIKEHFGFLNLLYRQVFVNVWIEQVINARIP